MMMEPILATRAGPKGPSANIPPFSPRLILLMMALRASVPPRVVDPRTLSNPSKRAVRAAYSPSRLWLIMAVTFREPR
jgi:hypothetical protein